VTAAAAKAQESTPQQKLAQAQRLQDAGFTDDADKVVKSVVQDSEQTPPDAIAKGEACSGPKIEGDDQQHEDNLGVETGCPQAGGRASWRPSSVV
jgi:hypothetical protein